MRDIFVNLVREYSKKNDVEITDALSLGNDLGLDSLSIVLLYSEVEDKFNIVYSPLDDDFGAILSTVGSLWEFILRRGSLT